MGVRQRHPRRRGRGRAAARGGAAPGACEGAAGLVDRPVGRAARCLRAAPGARPRAAARPHAAPPCARPHARAGRAGATSTSAHRDVRAVLAARELQWDAFDTPEERRALNRPRLREDFEESQRGGIPARFLATRRRSAGRNGARRPVGPRRLPDRRVDGGVGARPRRLPRARARALGVRRRARDAGARDAREAGHLVPDPAPARLRGGLHAPSPRGPADGSGSSVGG